MSEHIPMRTCIGCRQVRQKRELIRIVRSADGGVRADPSGRAPGRGAYLCADPECLEKACRRKAFQRTFSCAVSREDVAALQEELSSQIQRRREAAPDLCKPPEAGAGDGGGAPEGLRSLPKEET